MSKFCQFCGKELEDNVTSCPSCGNDLSVGLSTPEAAPVQPSAQPVQAAPVTFQSRNIVLCVVLSFITCGIYGIYWYICLANETNSVSDNNKTYGGAVDFLLTIVTCGIYGYYWNYQLGKKMYDAGVKYGRGYEDNSVLYLILTIFGLGIVNECIVQSQLNELAGNK